MISFDALNEQNHQITELANVLSYLMKDRAMCDNGVTCKLFFEYVERVQEHLDLEDKHLYARLLTHRDNDICNTAKLFLSGSMEIQRIFKAYQKKWCPKDRQSLKVADYGNFRRETEEMFGMVLRRIQDETEKLYPLVREVAAADAVA